MAPRYEAVVFDLDGTLIDSLSALARAIHYARRRCGLGRIADEVIRDAVGDGLEMLLSRSFAPDEVPAEARGWFEEHYDEICCEESRALTDVESTLEALEAAGVRMAVCTNKPTAFSVKILEHLGLAPRFAAVVGPDAAGARKPAGAHVLATLSHLDCAPERALLVGDMPVDVAAARDAGLDVATVPTGSASREALLDARPDFFLEHFREVLDLVAPAARAAGPGTR
ncbi:MAG TPA: HAD-IA family hydrolase [Thermoanaerobaculia bacterium]|nr:HAD-IA family hydrolase [Thermoanaerobaculia bacterium]